jgi:hypothetical protein
MMMGGPRTVGEANFRWRRFITSVTALGLALGLSGCTPEQLNAYQEDKMKASGTLKGDDGKEYRVQLETDDPAPVPDAPPQPSEPVFGSTVVIGDGYHPVAGVDIPRAANALVVYTPKSGTATPTNIYGAEAAVAVVGADRSILSVSDRQSTRLASGTPIPAGGYVLSGHGTARDWLLTRARVGLAPSFANEVPAPAPLPPTQPEQPVTDAALAYPTKPVAVYHMMWPNSGSPRLDTTPANVNVINLAFGQGSPLGLVGWASEGEASFVTAAKALRARGKRIVLSIGGAGGHVNTGDRAGFVRGFMAINAKVPLDGIDWDLEGVGMNQGDILAICAELRRLRGPNFAITMAPNGSNIGQYLPIAVALHQAGMLTMIGQQFYDAVVSPSAALGRVNEAVRAGIPASKYMVGMMVGTADTYWTVEECLAAYRVIKDAHPSIAGAYLWEAGRAGTSDWATRVGGLILS